LQAAQDSSRHRAERRGTPLALGFEQAAERVEVVAGDNRTPRRKFMHEVRVAVIDEVKQVGIRQHSPQVSRILYEASEQSSRHSRAGEAHRRTKPLSVHLAQVLAEHLADEVHARPALFGEVADHRHANSIAQRLWLEFNSGGLGLSTQLGNRCASGAQNTTRSRSQRMSDEAPACGYTTAHQLPEPTAILSFERAVYSDLQHGRANFSSQNGTRTNSVSGLPRCVSADTASARPNPHKSR
jgi:hypothetical protein